MSSFYSEFKNRCKLCNEGHTFSNLASCTGLVTTIAGQTTSGYVDAVGTLARFNYPHEVAVDSTGTLYVADTGSNMLRKVTIEGNVG